jgi:hypothetical protein
MFICGLFNDAVSRLGNSEKCIGKVVGETDCCLILRYYPNICLEGLKETMET